MARSLRHPLPRQPTTALVGAGDPGATGGAGRAAAADAGPPREALGGPPGKAPESLGDQGEPIEATFRTSDEPAALVPLAPMLDQLRGLGEQLTALAGRNEALALEAGQLRERTTQQAETIAELRRRAAAAEEERDAPRLQLAEASVPPVVVVAAQEAPEEAPATIPAPTTARGLWPRLRRALRNR